MDKTVDTREIILKFIKENGPTLPAKVAKHIGAQLMMASAHLAEMTDTGKLKVSHLKIGGSPLYYIPGQEMLIERYADNLDEKDKRAFDLLKEHHVLRDIELEPLQRVSLRSIQDFAIPLTVTYNGKDEIFWKGINISAEEAQQTIALYLNPEEAVKSPPQKDSPKETEREAKKEPAPIQKSEAMAERKEIVSAAPSEKEVPKKEKKPKKSAQKEAIEKSNSSEAENSSSADKKPKTEPISSEFEAGVDAYLSKNNIKIISKNVIKKNSDIEYAIHIPSPFGPLEYLLRAKSKKKVSDSDISTIAVQGQLRKLPIILLSDGELTKKGAEMLASLKGINFYRV